MSARIRRLLVRQRRRLRAPHLELGEIGERQALEFLKSQNNYRIVATNYKVLLGRGMAGRKVTGEIDIIAYDDDVLTFVEVKTRAADSLAPPEAAVNLRKQRQIARAARRYRELMRVMDEPYRYDVVTMTSTPTGLTPVLLKSYFDDSVFNRARYFRY